MYVYIKSGIKWEEKDWVSIATVIKLFFFSQQNVGFLCMLCCFGFLSKMPLVIHSPKFHLLTLCVLLW